MITKPAPIKPTSCPEFCLCCFLGVGPPAASSRGFRSSVGFQINNTPVSSSRTGSAGVGFRISSTYVRLVPGGTGESLPGPRLPFRTALPPGS